MRAGVIDIGSSSIKLVIGEKSGKDILILESLKNMVPFGRHTFFKEAISQQTINQTINILENYKRSLKEYDVSDIKVIATTAIREARNKNIFLDTIHRKTGLKINVFNVGDVVYYIDSYLSHILRHAFPIHEKNVLIAELGAGSIDFSIMQKGYIVMNIGLPIGTLRLKQFMAKLNASANETFEAVKEYIENEFYYLNETVNKIAIDDIILIDENYSVYLQNILHPKKTKEKRFFEIKKGEAGVILEHLAETGSETIINKYKVPAEMADLINGYAMVLNSLFSLQKKGRIYIFETSLAEAILSNMICRFEHSKKYNKTNQLIAASKFICNKFDADKAHAHQVATLSQILFKNLREFLGLKITGELYLTLASYLHDIGMFIHNRAHHKHSEYIINVLTLPKLTDEEIKIIACIARYHRKAPPLKTHINFMSLPSKKQILVQKLSSLIRIANALDRSHKQKVKRMDVSVTSKQDVILTVYTDENFIQEKTNFLDKKRLFEQITGNKINLIVKNEY